ncbi:hypothetical protein HX021_10680 [Sphingobacterium sp. N143]|uniref:hypothetical protein n=1 Tax=Sphingobacterium sp. N143 TaxID=2746727 RepID=UPI0025777DDA|nr:hypothetical protein [Sphingobacterium sp. N143]MDM1294752.1 hypothetical protein [Sphingobacterium sp. N143]
MIFKRLNYQVLQNLRLEGYNILLTGGRVEDETPIYFPMKLTSLDMEDILIESKTKNMFQGQSIIILDEAIQRSLNNDLSGIIQFDD